jgi:CHAT domain-containing protein
MACSKISLAANTMKLSRRSKLVVLAACATAHSENERTQRSLADAFLKAGASSVVGTLWAIDDSEASTFFPRLHAHVSGGMAPAQALRATQLEYIRRGAPPQMWAAVQLIGS